MRRYLQRNSKEKAEKWSELLKDVGAELGSKAQNSQKPDKKFITQILDNDTWTPARLELFIECLKVYDLTGAQLERVQDNVLQKRLSKTISILIDIKWDKWKLFTEVFCEVGGKRLVTDLPHDFKDLVDPGFL